MELELGASEKKKQKLGKQKIEIGPAFAWLRGVESPRSKVVRGESREERGAWERGAGRVAPVQLRLRRADQGNRFALVTAVNVEVLAIDRNDAVLGKKLVQANQAQIGQIGLTVGVA